METVARADQQQVTIQLFLLGGFRAERTGRPLPDGAWRRRSGRTLVKLLATAPAHRLHREQIQELLWPDLAPEPVANTFRKAMHFARHALDPSLPPRRESELIYVRDDTVILSPELIWIDADDFRTRARTALATGDQATIEHALAAYQGELLPEDRFEDWTVEPRRALADLYGGLLTAVAALHERSGRYVAAVESHRRLVALDPSREDIHREVMRLAALGGQRHQALRQYRLCREALQREVDAEPDPETEALYQAILAGRVGGQPQAGTVSPASRSLTLPLPVRRLVTGPLIGREPALTLLIDALGRTGDGQGGAILVGGEAGVGKTRLVAEAAREAHDRATLVLWGAGYEQEGQLPYGPLVEALDRAIANLTADARLHLATISPDLANLIPALGSGTQGIATPGAGDVDRTRLFAAVAHLLDALSGEHPLVLILDDLHAADTATFQLLHHLARLAGERRWLLLGTYREEDVGAGNALDQLRTVGVRNGLFQRIDLGRLRQDDCDHLIATLLAGGDVPRALRNDLYGRSLGNPLFIQELVRAMRDQELLTLDAGRWTVAGDGPPGVPRRLSDLIDVRVDRLGDAVRRVLAVVATAGEECSFRLLQQAGEMADDALLDALDRALATHLLEERGTGYGFRHPLVRATLYERLSKPRRARLHAALATAIERQPDPSLAGSPERIEALAHHWAAAGEAGRAVPYLIQAAGHAAQIYANAEAITRLRRALSLIDTTTGGQREDPALRAALLERIGDLQALIGDNAQARAAYETALDTAGVANLSVGRLHRKTAQQAMVAGDLATAGDRLALAERSLDAGGRSQPELLERARCLTVRAQTHFLGFRFPEALAAAEASARLADAAASPADLDQATELIAMTSLQLGHWRRGLEHERRHPGLSDLNQFVQDVADVHICLSEYYMHRDPEHAVHSAELFTRALAESERVGAPRSLALCHYFLGTMAYFGGRFEESVSHLTSSIHLYEQIDSASGTAIARMMRGITQTALGHLDAGRRDLERGLSTAEHAPARLRSHTMIRLYAGLAKNRLDANDPAGARRYAEAGLSLADEPSTCICYAALHPVASFAFALTGDLDRAAALAQQALTHARDLDSPFYCCVSHQALAMVHTMAGTWEEAFAALDEAWRLAEMHSYPYERGRILLLRAFVHTQRRQARDVAVANALTAEAWPMLLQLGVRTPAASV